MEPKYYTVDSKKPKPHPRLQNLLSFFEASSSSSSLNGGGGDSAKRTPPALPPRLYHSATTSDFNSSSSGNIDHTNTNSNNNNNPSSDHHNNLELTSPPPTPPPPSSTIGSGSPSTHDLMSARTMITDPVAVQMLDKLNRELQQERSAHLQSRNRIRVLEEENRQIREQNSRLQSRLSKVWQHYNSFQKVMAETYNSNSNNNSNFDSQSDYSVSPPLHSSNGSNSFNNNNSSNNINNSNNSSSSGIYQVARPLGGFNQPHTRSKSNTVSGDYKHFTNSLLQNGSVNSNSSFLLNNSNGSVNNATNNGNNNNNNNNSNNGGNAINNGNSSTRSKSMSVSHMSLSGGSPPNSQLLNTSTGYLQELVDQNSTVGDDASQSHFTEDDYARMLDKRRGIAYQILKTEKEYASHLQLIVEEFLNPMRIESYQSSNPFVTTLHVKQLFGDVEVILGSSGLLIEDLEKVLNNTSNLGLGEVFLKICDYFKLYSPYVKNYYSSISILNKLKEESHKFQAFIHEKEQKLESTNFTDLGSLLVLPLSRIGQYTPMLFEMYMSTPKSHADFDLFKNAVSKMKSIVDYVKEKSREYESQNKVRIIQNLLIGKFNNLNEPHRRYVREGLLTEILARNSGNQLHCFLFNDMFLVSSPIVKKQQTHYVFKKDIRLAEAEVTIVSDQDEKPLFQISFTSQLSQSGSDSPSSNITANSVLNGIINGGPISGGGSSSGADNESRETLTFCADSVRDREEWVQALAHYISQEKKKQANRRPEESTIENRGGEIDFKNSDIQLCEQIGSGGSGCTVHRCTVDGFTCAVKVLKLKNTQSFLIDQFVSEINIMEQLNHQNIAKYLGHRLTTNPERLWLFMEFYPYSLKDIISKRNAPFPTTEVIWMALEIAKGLEFLHNQKPPIIHRDLKPGNIMCLLDERNRVSNIRVCDFDTSKVLGSGVTLKTCIGTPCYMAPEVLDVSMEATGDGYTLKADIWSFSMLVFEIISLLPPYHQFPHLQTVEMILKGTPPPLTSNISPNLSGLIDLLHHCIDINPSKRPTASQVVSKLVKLLKSSGKLQE